MDGSELLRPEEEYIGKRKSISMDKDEDNFRVYDENCTSEIQERVKKTYYEMHTNQTMEFVQKKVKNVTFLNRKWISPRKLIPDQGKVYPRAVFTPRGSALQPRAKRGL